MLIDGSKLAPARSQSSFIPGIACANEHKDPENIGMRFLDLFLSSPFPSVHLHESDRKGAGMKGKEGEGKGKDSLVLHPLICR